MSDLYINTVQVNHEKHMRKTAYGNINLSLQDILFIYSEVHTGPQFDNIIIAWVRTTQGQFDILFHADGELVTQDGGRQTIGTLEQFYKKKFTGILIDTIPAWAMQINN